MPFPHLLNTIMNPFTLVVTTSSLDMTLIRNSSQLNFSLRIFKICVSNTTRRYILKLYRKGVN